MQNAFPTLDPVDYAVVRAAFVELVHADWFERSTENIAAAAKVVVAQYAPGIDVVELQARSEPLLKSTAEKR